MAKGKKDVDYDVIDVDDEDCSDDDVDKKKKSKKNDFLSVGIDILGNINYKVAIFLFLVGLIIFSDLFVNKVLNIIDGTVSTDGTSTTTKGTVLQLMLLCILYIVVDLLNTYKII